MRRSLVVVAVIVCSVAAARMTAQAPPAEERFRVLGTRWMDALAAQDGKVLESPLAREFTLIGLGSTLEDIGSSRQEWLGLSLKRPFPKHDVRVVKVAENGDTAVVQSILTGEYRRCRGSPKAARCGCW